MRIIVDLAVVGAFILITAIYISFVVYLHRQLILARADAAELKRELQLSENFARDCKAETAEWKKKYRSIMIAK